MRLGTCNYASLYTRYLSSCLFVGCTHSPRSHSYLCDRGFAMHLEIHRVYIRLICNFSVFGKSIS
ncbi:hypothetical protein EIL81_14145 [Photorhabdus laumondii subsp. laumondii]|nr:hypothetical protein [Photorhabdus laumondii subsp. laumondii]